MKQQQFAVIVLFALIIASGLTSFSSYSSTSRLVCEDMDRALALALEEQQSDVINQDTIRTFNNHLQIAELRGKATLAVDTRGQKFKAYAHCSEATIFSLSDQRPATVLWVLTGFWAMLMWYRRRQSAVGEPLTVTVANRNAFGGLTYLEEDGRFYAADGNLVQLTPMKPDASETLYTLIRRLKPVIEQHSDLKIESDRSKSYSLKVKSAIK